MITPETAKFIDQAAESYASMLDNGEHNENYLNRLKVYDVDDDTLKMLVTELKKTDIWCYKIYLIIGISVERRKCEEPSPFVSSAKKYAFACLRESWKYGVEDNEGFSSPELTEAKEMNFLFEKEYEWLADNL